MPKIIPQVRERLIASARATLLERGYGALSVREAAAACQIAVGTFYNYFKSKNELAAAVMLEDWGRSLKGADEAIEALSPGDDRFRRGMEEIYDRIDGFAREYRPAWREYAQSDGPAMAIYAHHPALRGQIAQRIERLCQVCGEAELIPFSAILAEMVLSAVTQEDISRDLFVSFLARARM